jgi:alkylated DNA nucleotide flippase Atl1
MSWAEVLAVSLRVEEGEWTTYQEVGHVVYGHRKAAQSVGSAMREEGHESYAHRVLRGGGKVADTWRGAGGGPEECIRRLTREGVWDARRDRARPEAFVDAAELQLRS